MAKQTININSPDDLIGVGSSPNAGNGDPLRLAFRKINDAFDKIDQNFTELYNSSGGGTANTGDVTFNGVKVIGSGTASGDGLGFSTLELVPDGTLNTDQYIIVDPTQPNHIHIRAGGTQDASTADLFLGGERNYVRVRDGIGVRINNDTLNSTENYFQAGVDYDTATWVDEGGTYWVYITISNPSAPTREPSQAFSQSFYSFGQFTEDRLFVLDGTPLTYAGNSGTMGNPYEYRVQVNEAPPASPTSLVDFRFLTHIMSYNSLLMEQNSLDASVSGSVSYYADGGMNFTTGNFNLRLQTNDNTNTRSWTFTTKGYIEFPQGVAPTSSKGSVGDEIGSVAFDGTYIYYCTATYTDGLADIWKRVQWSADTW